MLLLSSDLMLLSLSEFSLLIRPIETFPSDGLLPLRSKRSPPSCDTPLLLLLLELDERLTSSLFLWLKILTEDFLLLFWLKEDFLLLFWLKEDFLLLFFLLLFLLVLLLVEMLSFSESEVELLL